VAPDIPGFGDTQRPADGFYTPSRWVEHLVALLDALGLDRVSVLGNSFGGALALRLATEHPDRVDRLALMGSAGLSLPVTPSPGKVWGYRPSFEAMRGLVDVLTYDTSLVTDDLVRLRFEASTRPGSAGGVRADVPTPPPGGAGSPGGAGGAHRHAAA
jgi:2-hydroxymuconate-semialdehyde hydrolase